MIAMSKPLASLSSALLARKGQARPAMRRQGALGEVGLAEAGDLLGWNDMGDPETVPAEAAEVAPEPPVLAERAALVEAVRVMPALSLGKPRKAFTLRLDQERHLRLRVAVATQRRSAQQLVTEALDAFLATLPAAGASDANGASGE
jgi:hypothetical protein